MKEPQETTRQEFDPDRADAIHRALLTGLLSNVGAKTDTPEYIGARSTRFNIFPGSALFRRRPAWTMAGEIVETSKTYARTVASVRPEWIERAAQHLLKRNYVDPHWQSKSAHVVAYEKVLLYGLVLVPRRLVHYGPIDPVVSREIFINHALVDMDYRSSAEFFVHNQRLVEQVEHMEAKARRKNLLVDPQVRYAWYAARVPEGIYNGPLLEKWRREAERENPRLLFMSLADLLRGDASDITPERFPDEVTIGDMRLPLTYRFEPGTSDDGVTLHVPLHGLNQLRAEPFTWLVPGMLVEKILALIRSLPKATRVKFVPAPDTARDAATTIKPGDGALIDALATYLGKISGQRIVPGDFDLPSLEPYLRMNFRVEDAAGQTIGMSRDLVALQRDLGAQVQQDLAKLPVSEYHREGITQWDFGDLPQRVEIKRHGMTVAAYPAVVDQKNSVSLRLLDAAETARQQTRAGVRRLFLIQLREETRYLARHVPGLDRAAMVYATLGSGRDLKQDLLVAAADRALFAEGEIRTREQFLEKARNGWRYLSAAATEIGATLVAIMQEYQEVAKILSTDASPAWLEGFADAREQLKHLLPAGFIATTSPQWFEHLPRFVRAIRVRLQKLTNAGATRDAQAMAQVREFWDQYTRKSVDNARRGLVDPELEQFRWMIEELRVSLFAQELKTSIPISPQRLGRQWQLVRK